MYDIQGRDAKMISPVTTSITTAGADRKEQMAEVAMQFEKLFADMMMKSMRQSVPDNPLIKKSTGEKIYTEMLDGQYSEMMVKNSSMGLASTIIRQMEMKENGGEISKTLRSLQQQQYSDMSSEYSTGESPELSATLRMLQPEYNGLQASITEPKVAEKALEAFTPQIKQWEAIINVASEKYGVKPELIAAIISAESGGNARATSPVGAQGLMQLMPATARELGVQNSYNPEQNIMGGTKYISQMLNRFDNDERLALAAYNAGPSAVRRHNGIPPYRETQNYVTKIMNQLGEEE